MVDEVDLGSEFFRVLEQFDEGVARRVAAAGCPRCAGPLHRGDYARKPRGALIARAGETSVVRFSLCCGREGCRKRATPPSLRFLGRRVYLGVVVIVASLFAQWLGSAEVSRPVTAVTGVPARTTRRWVGWWCGAFVDTEVFLAVRARLVGVAIGELPASIVAKLPGTWPQRVRAVLEFLAPLTTGSLPAGSPFLRVTA
jgi:hypothetical protein